MRIDALFRGASITRVAYLQYSLSVAEIARLAGRAALVFLIDVRALNRARHFFVPYGHYVGHYILVCGFDPTSRRFFYLDPAESPGAY